MGIVASKGSVASVTFSTPQEIVINKDDDTITAHQGGTWNVNNVSGTVSLPTGAATAANQATANTALDAIQDATENLYALKLDEASSTVTYVGKAAIGTAGSSAAWQVKKITVSGTVTSTTWADSNASFDNVWDNRASLTYG